MNIGLIKKYKTEFDHLLNGGKLLFCNIHEKKWINLTDRHWSAGLSTTMIVINDEYVEFRKALAEGKTIEFKHPQCGFADWQIVTEDHIFQSIVCGREYRIKQEQFKVGDFVKLNNDIAIVSKIIDGLIDHLTYKGNFYLPKQNDTITKWKPQAGEICWFTDDKHKQSILGTFEKMEGSSFKNKYWGAWRYCEPFLNSKPSWFNN